MFKKMKNLLPLIILPTLLLGCISLGGVNYKQAHMLKKEGFTLTEEGWALGLPKRILFNFDDAKLTKVDSDNIKNLAYQLKQYHLEHLKIIGHADDIGNELYNIKLSKQRADHVAVIFYNNGFNTEDIQTIGKGSSQPFILKKDRTSRASNRRVTIVIVP